MSIKKKEPLCYIVLALSVAAVYANVYGGPFILDDLNMIARNGALLDWNKLPELLTGMTGGGVGYLRPLQMLLYAFVAQAFGLAPAAFHALNVAIHAANACLVHRLGCRLGFDSRAVFGLALLWAVHPVHTEAVAYISGTAELLFTFFCLAGVLALLPNFRMDKIYRAGSFLVLALASKESAVVFPALAGAAIYLLHSGRLKPRTYGGTWPLWVIAALYAGLTLLFYHVNPQLTLFDRANTAIMTDYVGSPVNRVLTALGMLPAYLGILLWPARLHMDHDFVVYDSLTAWPVLLGLALALAAAVQVLGGRGRRGLGISFGLIWFFAAMSPNFGVVMPLQATFSEHWLYLPSIGLFLGVAAALSPYMPRFRALFAALVIIAAAALGVRTLQQNVVWGSQFAFYSNIIDSGAKSGRAHVHLSLYHAVEGNFDAAIEHAQAAIRHPAPMPLAVLPGLYVDLAIHYIGAQPENFEDGIITPESLYAAVEKSERLAEAEAALEKALTLDPKMTYARQVLDLVREQQDRAARQRLQVRPPDAAE